MIEIHARIETVVHLVYVEVIELRLRICRLARSSRMAGPRGVSRFLATAAKAY